jgi:hypothetical protein
MLRCYAEHLVDKAGLDQLRQDRFLTSGNTVDIALTDPTLVPQLSSQTVDAIVEATYDCVAWQELPAILGDTPDELDRA